MIFKIIIPARANSKRLPGKNMKILGGKPLIQHSIDFALKNFSNKNAFDMACDLKCFDILKKISEAYNTLFNIDGDIESDSGSDIFTNNSLLGDSFNRISEKNVTPSDRFSGSLFYDSGELKPSGIENNFSLA